MRLFTSGLPESIIGFLQFIGIRISKRMRIVFSIVLGEN